MPRTLKRHDTADPITGIARATSATGDLVRVDLTVFESVELHLRVEGAPEAVILTAEVVETTDGAGTPGPLNSDDGLPENRGKFRCPLVDADVDTSGVYGAELECVLANGLKVHFPNAKAANETVTIDDDLDDA